MQSETDEELLNKWFEGEQQAFELFFNRHSKRITGYCVKKGLRREDAEDVTQRVFIKLSQSIHQYERGRPALPWLYSIVINEFRDHMRALSRYDKRIENYTIVESQQRGEENDRNQSSNLLKAAEGVLSAESLNVVRQRILEDKSFEQVGASTGKNSVASRKMFQRAIEKLKKWILSKEEERQ